jgi:hypothetical protein
MLIAARSSHDFACCARDRERTLEIRFRFRRIRLRRLQRETVLPIRDGLPKFKDFPLSSAAPVRRSPNKGLRIIAHWKILIASNRNCDDVSNFRSMASSSGKRSRGKRPSSLVAGRSTKG